ncbi:Extracellular calcium-sensing receptor [Channa argus]|uniref:Extracellular calcium-sensing receptor n=1 Tax=Channa argus TaxID=215402 RepID=A0A6G1PQQ1_CHAAH|nr:Extracellular calcium-sensing receptor [Channa argus]
MNVGGARRVALVGNGQPQNRIGHLKCHPLAEWQGGRCTFGSAPALDNCVFLGDNEKNSLYEDGDVVIGGLFPLHYSPVSFLPTFKTKPPNSIYKYFSSRALRWMQTMTFAIKEINQRSDILPQLKLGFHIRDSCDDISVSLRALLLLVNGQPETTSTAGNNVEKKIDSNLGCGAVQRTVSPVVIGDAGSGVSMALLRSLGSFHIPLAVYLVAHALQEMSNCKVGKGPFLNGTCGDPKNFEPWQLIHYMKHVNFSAMGEKVNFDQNGDPIAYYDLVNWQKRPDGSLHLLKVGFYDAATPAGRSLIINDSVIQWPIGKQDEVYSFFKFDHIRGTSCPHKTKEKKRNRDT